MKWIVALLAVSVLATGIIQAVSCSRDYQEGYFYE